MPTATAPNIHLFPDLLPTPADTPPPIATPRRLRELCQCIHRTCGRTRLDYIHQLVLLTDGLPGTVHDLCLNTTPPTVRPNRQTDAEAFAAWVTTFEARLADFFPPEV